MTDDLINRADTFDVLADYYHIKTEAQLAKLAEAISRVPSAEPTLYGYKIEHLAYIASVMEKTGVTAEYFASTYDDMRLTAKMLIDEMRRGIEGALAYCGAKMEGDENG